MIVIRWSRPAKDAVRGVDLGTAVRPEGLKANAQEAIAGLALDGGLGAFLLRQGLAEQIEKEAKGMRVERAQLRQARRPPGGEAQARCLDLLGFLGEPLLQQPAGRGASRTRGSGPRGATSPYSRNLRLMVRAGASAQGVPGPASPASSGTSAKCRAGLSANATRASLCASASLAHPANQEASTRKSIDRSLRPLRRSLRARRSRPGCGIAARPRAQQL